MTFGLGRLGASFGKMGAGAGSGSSTPAPSLTAPVLAFASATDPSNDTTQDFNLTVTAPAVDDVLTLQWDNNSDFSSVTGSATYTILSGDLIDFTGEITTGALADGAQYFRAKHSRGGTDSAWSNTVTKVIDATAPTLSNATDTATGQTTADVGVDTNEANGTLYCVVTTSSTNPTPARVKLGQDNSGVAAAYAANQVISSTGTKAVSATGLTAATAYTAHFMHEDAVGNQSTVVKGNGLTTSAASATTWDPAHTDAALTLTGSNLIATNTGGTGYNLTRSAVGLAGGKYYCEFTPDYNGTEENGLGLGIDAALSWVGSNNNGLGYYNNGNVYRNGGVVATYATFADLATVDIAIDDVNFRIWFRVNNGNWNNSGAADPAANVGGLLYSGLAAGTKYVAWNGRFNTDVITAKFGSFSRTPPSGFSGLA